jgi:hypothetical protein
MHLRTSIVRRGSKTYKYVQLVQSVRGADGTPTHKVLASLGDLPALLIENFRVALAAHREGQAVLLSAEMAAARPIRANLRYLDLAVFHRLWNESGLRAVVERVLEPRDADVPSVDIVEALVLQRCVAPGSKLASERWFPTTALPELLNIAARTFNNTRLHRVLDDLAESEASLLAKLPEHVAAAEGAFAVLFADITDTWFEGEGPPLAGKGKDKTGVYRQRMGIALVCDQHGHPLRWKTLPGRYHDATELGAIVQEAGQMDWVGDLPFVVDRALGNGRAVETLVDSGRRFLTGLPTPDFASYHGKLPWNGLADVVISGAPEMWKTDIEAAVRAARVAKFELTPTGRWVYDLSIFNKGDHTRKGPSERRPSNEPTRAVAALRLAQTLRPDPEVSHREVARQTGLARKTIDQHRELLQLTPVLQARVLNGDADRFDLTDLRAVAVLDPERQAPVFQAKIASVSGRKPLRPSRARLTLEPPLRLRGVLTFGPERFVQDRTEAFARRAEFNGMVEDISSALAGADCRRKASSILTELGTFLKRWSLGDVVDVAVVTRPDAGRVLEVTWNEPRWREKRRTDGLTFLVAHPALTQPAAEIADLFAARDQVEKAFQTIKSTVHLRPIRHWTDAKVRAHVTICMLALLLERMLERRLRDGGNPLSGPRAVETLATCHLNQLDGAKVPLYLLTVPTPEQNKILETLSYADLTTPEGLVQIIHPR